MAKTIRCYPQRLDKYKEIYETTMFDTSRKPLPFLEPISDVSTRFVYVLIKMKCWLVETRTVN